MGTKAVLRSSPRRLVVDVGGRETSYELAEDMIASHGPPGSGDGEVLNLDGGAISVAPSHRVSDSDSAVLGPVYRQVPGGGIAVPTGRVLVRFAEGDPAKAHQADLAAAGFRLEQALGYAPHAAWVRPVGDEIVPAVEALDRLAALPGVEHVEPQLITESQTR